MINLKLKNLRKEKKLTQAKCAEYLGIPLRTYQNYENDESKSGSIKYAFMLQKLEEYGVIDESHGVLSIEQIREICTRVFEGLEIEYCYLFGSYAKGTANDNSDVDLMVKTDISGLKFYDLIEKLREELNKKVDLLNFEQLNNNLDLINEILKDGIKIYG
ncbi:MULTISPECIES: nucleotidyltransferase domain-containing protein [Peptacetobacter]|uniref:Nucleotidyltransferase domain protein n=1 Tax=Peptacetobacter hiranonis (strain DSM 13275 / JCM 10541 / KCTC 15199 / TO-931) TaxID=500633 RepID=B6FY27_PEPHT|nr:MULTISPECIES: nucleotidyltransferase domain-containing protein [Peptacetobacter]EEA85574.1 nucleotidyltransferase domain protein [Peptacetobacter hiranonis DSM 13275]MEE0450698.1 nucleotidyltransferase domain-containing protein [Peptacetobacter sp.]